MRFIRALPLLAACFKFMQSGAGCKFCFRNAFNFRRHCYSKAMKFYITAVLCTMLTISGSSALLADSGQNIQIISNISGSTAVLSATNITTQQGRAWAKSKGATETFISLADKYWLYAEETGGVNPALAYAQAALETGYGNFKGVLDESFNNPCGIKTAAGGNDKNKNAHQRFTSWEEGVIAHLDHLALYAGAAGYPKTDSPDPRHFPYLLGKGTTVSTMSKSWCPGNSQYTHILVRMMMEMASM